ncbi:MAG: tol-pal system protein YbgF [Rubrivivax sp.]|nr:tol-pal system protein YbgF [Rubrivivax sp.]
MAHAIWRPLALAAALAWAGTAQAGLFDDEEARKAILDLRARIQAVDDAGRKSATDGATANTQMLEQLTAMRRSLLELNNQLEAMRGELAKLRGDGEQMARDLATLQRTQKDANQNFDERLRKMEPQKVTLDGREFSADPAEKRGYDEAMAIIREGNFDAAATALSSFLGKYPNSGYGPTARFWLGNALYGKRDYKGAIAAFRGLVTDAPDHARAPEALLAVANSQAEMKDPRAARRTIDELLKAYPQSEAAAAGKERLAALK